VQLLVRASGTPEIEVVVDHDRSCNSYISYQLAGLWVTICARCGNEPAAVGVNTEWRVVSWTELVGCSPRGRQHVACLQFPSRVQYV
jgi:hypothetical protein